MNISCCIYLSETTAPEKNLQQEKKVKEKGKEKEKKKMKRKAKGKVKYWSWRKTFYFVLLLNLFVDGGNLS